MPDDEKKQSLADVSKKIRETGMTDDKPSSEEAPKPGASESVAEPPAPKPKTPEQMRQDPNCFTERDKDAYRAYAAPEVADPFRRAEEQQQESLRGRGGLPDEV